MRGLAIPHRGKGREIERCIHLNAALHNFSSKQLTEAETEILARGFYPHRLNLLKINIEFENTYSEIKRHLAPKHILDFKLKMLNLCLFDMVVWCWRFITTMVL